VEWNSLLFLKPPIWYEKRHFEEKEKKNTLFLFRCSSKKNMSCEDKSAPSFFFFLSLLFEEMIDVQLDISSHFEGQTLSRLVFWNYIETFQNKFKNQNKKKIIDRKNKKVKRKNIKFRFPKQNSLLEKKNILCFVKVSLSTWFFFF